MKVADLVPRRGLCIVRPYERPDHLSEHIRVNPAWAVDRNRNLWEVVSPHPDHLTQLGYELREDDIVMTPAQRGLFLAHEDGVDYFVIREAEIVNVMRWKER